MCVLTIEKKQKNKFEDNFSLVLHSSMNCHTLLDSNQEIELFILINKNYFEDIFNSYLIDE